MIPVLYPHLEWSDLVAFFSVGKNVDARFAEKLGETFRSEYSLTYSSGRAGLYHILKSNGLTGKDVLVTAYTCCVVTEAIAQSGNRNLFVDTGDGSFNADMLEERINEHRENLGAVVITNLYGFSDYKKLGFLAKERDYLVIIDDALSPGDVPTAPRELCDYIYISGAVRKPFTSLGGGMVFTDDEKKFNALREYTLAHREAMPTGRAVREFLLTFLFFFAFRPAIYSMTSWIRRKTKILDVFFAEAGNDIHTVNPEYFHDMSDFQKRIGLNQLNKLGRLLELRREIGDRYYELLSPRFDWVKTFWRVGVPYSHVPFLHQDRDELERYLLENGIDCERYFDYVVPELAQYHDAGHYPNANGISEKIINLPINVGMDDADVRAIAEKIIEFDGRPRS